MKRCKIFFGLFMVILLATSVVSYASLADFCHHNYSRTNNIYFSVQNHTSSIYAEKNGRKAWWPVIYYDDYVDIQYSCAECGKRIPELDVIKLVGEHWEFAY